MVDTKKLLGKKIKETRKHCGLTQENLSEKINIDVTTLSGIESGRHFPSLPTLEKIANILNVDLQTLFNFNHFKSIKEMREDIITNLNFISDDDIKFIHKFIDQKYIQKD